MFKSSRLQHTSRLFTMVVKVMIVTMLVVTMMVDR